MKQYKNRLEYIFYSKQWEKNKYSVFAVTTDAKAKLLANPGVLILPIETFVDVR